MRGKDVLILLSILSLFTVALVWLTEPSRVEDQGIRFCNSACFIGGKGISHINSFPYTCVCKDGTVFDSSAMERYFKGRSPR